MALPKSLSDRVREARLLVSSNPSVVANIDVAEKRKAEQAAADAKRRTDAQSKVDSESPLLADALLERDAQIEQQAKRAAALEAAQWYLRVKHGLVQPQAIAIAGIPGGLTPALIERHRKRIDAATPLPWARNQSASATRSDFARQSAAASTRPKVVTPDEAVEARKRQVDEQRARKVAARKAAAGLPGWPKEAA